MLVFNVIKVAARYRKIELNSYLYSRTENKNSGAQEGARGAEPPTLQIFLEIRIIILL